MGTIRRKTKSVYFDVRDTLSANALERVSENLAKRALDASIVESATDYSARNKIADSNADFVVQFDLYQNGDDVAKVMYNRIKKDTTGIPERNTKKSREAAELMKHYLQTSDLLVSPTLAKNIPYEEVKRMGWFVESDVPYITLVIDCEEDNLEDVMDSLSESIIDWFGR